ncbi:TPA: scaffolding protein [Enterococcus faecium]|uniref:phage scaffolding protein n=1 Tax=Enterococcus faecium TaxID=1352 RepID=UPI001CC9815F|nr:phage scaffolding protein [Enterococcus faecium]HAZ1148806.1 scaffolding protein [Enterococcus faecium]HAZ1186000.1 scaffolding protein [Enterococcus faecium]HBK4066345.1 phage scaffolding protein [Enterococcus faecium]
MEWIKQILAKHTKEDGTVDLEAANKEIDKEFPQNAVPKDQYNNVSSQLSEANKTLKSLEEKTKDNPDVQKELSSLKEKAEALEKENTDLKINGQVSAALQASGAKDIDYALFKLGKLELDKDGNVKDLDNKVKDLKAAIPDYFSKEDGKEEKTPPAGYQTIDTKLHGQQQTTFSLEEINNMTPAQINENWEAVSASLEGGKE